MYLIPILCLVLTAVLFAAARALPTDVEKVKALLRDLSHNEPVSETSN